MDAVAFAVPPPVQAPLAIRAAEAGKHLLLEKPVALSVETADQLVAAVEKAGVASVVFFTWRFDREIRAWLADEQARGGWSGSGWSGGVAVWLGSSLQPGSPFNTPWRQEKGALWDLGPHMVAMLWACLGPVTSVTAVAGQGDVAHLVLGHEGGASSTATMTQGAPAAASGSSLFVWGAAGRSVMPAIPADPEQSLRVAAAELAAAAGREPAAAPLRRPLRPRRGRSSGPGRRAAVRPPRLKYRFIPNGPAVPRRRPWRGGRPMDRHGQAALYPGRTISRPHCTQTALYPDPGVRLGWTDMSSSPDIPQPRNLRASDADRENAANQLREAAGDGRLTMDELDERLDAVYAAKTYAELEPITHDLPSAGAPYGPAVSAGPGGGTRRYGGEASSRAGIAILGGFSRRGRWLVPRVFTAFALMGGGELDMRDASFAEPTVTVRVLAIMGGIEITVPEDATVRVPGIGIMGAFDDAAGDAGTAGGPTVVVSGLALMGGVSIRRRPPRRDPLPIPGT